MSAMAKRRLFFTSGGKTHLVNSDGTGLRTLDLAAPDQVTWQPGPFLSDGRRVVMLSMEARRDGPGRPFDEYYTQTPTHLWIHDLDRGTLTEICTRERIAVFYTPALLVGDERILVQVVKDRVGQIVSMHVDGTDARPFTKPGEGLPYGLSLSPDAKRVAYHLASPRGYEIWVSDTQGANRVRIAGEPGHLYFAPVWSPDGEWLLFQDCLDRDDPGHDWSDLCVARPTGGEVRRLTRGQSAWFAATYGTASARGGGSNVPVWTKDGAALFARRSDGARVPWEYQVGRPDTDHFNREFRPEKARGGTSVCRLDPRTGKATDLTPPTDGVWDFRASASGDGKEIVFCRAETGGVPSVWVMDSRGRRPRRIAQGVDGGGADHPRWLPVPR